MEKIRVAINGFGRIGRVVTRILLDRKEVQLVAVNDVTDTKTLAHLFRYDSVHGRFNGTVSYSADSLTINGNNIRYFSEKDPSQLKWRDLKVDLVIESTGHFLSRDKASAHLHAGARKVILSAPAKDDDIPAVVLGVNDHVLNAGQTIISNASCTTNCAAPMVHVIEENVGIESCFMTTVHSYTSDQRLHDSPHKDLRRARAAAVSIIPTTTGAAKAISRIFPHLEGKMGGAGIRVPVPNGSITDITFVVPRPVTVEEVNAFFCTAAAGKMRGILEYAEDPLVSVDIIGNSHSCIFDPELTSVVGNMVKVVGWYDNEFGYSSRLADLVEKVGRL